MDDYGDVFEMISLYNIRILTNSIYASEIQQAAKLKKSKFKNDF